jgi:hypothetical protein
MQQVANCCSFSRWTSSHLHTLLCVRSSQSPSRVALQIYRLSKAHRPRERPSPSCHKNPACSPALLVLSVLRKPLMFSFRRRIRRYRCPQPCTCAEQRTTIIIHVVGTLNNGTKSDPHTLRKFLLYLTLCYAVGHVTLLTDAVPRVARGSGVWMVV